MVFSISFFLVSSSLLFYSAPSLLLWHEIPATFSRSVRAKQKDYEDAIAVIEDIIETARKNVSQTPSIAKRLLRTALFALEEFEGDI